jgi:hypothetical protein
LFQMEGREHGGVKRKRCCEHCLHEGCLGQLPKDDGVTNQLSVHMPGLTIVNSKQQGGKSHLLRHICYKYRDRFEGLIAYSNSKDDGNNLDWFPKKFQYTFFENKDERYDGRKYLRALIAEQKKRPKSSRGLWGVIIDDDPSGFHSNELHIICTQAYKYNLWVWISVHNICDLEAGYREQVTNVALFEMESENSMKAAYKNYGKSCKRFKDFEMLLEKNTGDHKFLWRDVKNGKPFECWRCPPEVPKFFIDFGSENEEGDEK